MKEVDSELEHLNPRKRFQENNVKKVKKLKEGTTENSFLVESATRDLFILKKFYHFSHAKSILNNSLFLKKKLNKNKSWYIQNISWDNHYNKNISRDYPTMYFDYTTIYF